MDLGTVIEWAGQASIAGTPANIKVMDGLGPFIPIGSSVALVNPTSSRDNGVAPALTCVLLCTATVREGRNQFCVKFYPDSTSGLASMRRHESLLRKIGDTLPVPQVIEVLPSGAQLGFPALITTAIGDPLGEELRHLPLLTQAEIMRDLAAAVSELHQSDHTRFGMDKGHDRARVLASWREDSAWYRDNAWRAEGAADLVVQAAAILAERDDVPQDACLIHRDLTPYNVVVSDGVFAGIVDWDHAGVAAAQEEVAKAVIGLLIISGIPCDERLLLTAEFLRAYASSLRLSSAEFFEQCVPFAFDTILDWVIGIKNAPRDQLVWAMQQIVERNCT